MAVQIVVKEKRPKVAPENKDGAVITLSAAQHDPFLAQPADFTILTSEDAADAEHIGDGQHGTSAAEVRKLLRQSAGDKRQVAFPQLQVSGEKSCLKSSTLQLCLASHPAASADYILALSGKSRVRW